MHTKGPWKPTEWIGEDGRVYNGVDTDYPETLNSGACSICTINGIYYQDDKSLKQKCDDARLIAAAPELLEACKALVRLVQSYETPQNFVSSVQLDGIKAINIAEGRERA